MTVLNLLSRLSELDISIQLVNDRLKISGAEEKLTFALIDELKGRKGEIIEFLHQSTQNTIKYESIKAAETKEYYPLSSAQKRLYVLQQMNLDNISYNLPHISALDGSVDFHKLVEIFRKLVLRHDSLRTSFDLVNEEPVQKIHSDVDFKIKYFEVLPAEEGTNPVESIGEILKNFIRPFDLSKAPLLRVGLIKVKETGYILMIDLHHIITDGTSQIILTKEFMALFAGEELPPLRLQYKEYSEWQQNGKTKEALKRQEEFWLREFDGEIPVLKMPIDYSRPVRQSFEGNSVSFKLDADETLALNEIARTSEATLFMVLLAIFNIFLSKLCSQEDIVVGTPIVGRQHADLEKIIGMFVNTLALRNYPSGQKTFKILLKEIREKTTEAFENQDYQFEDLIEKVQVERDMSRNPLFDVMFSLQNFFDPPGKISEKEIEGLKIKPYPYEFKTAKFDLSLTAMESKEKLYFSFKYCTKLFRNDTIQRWITYFKNITALIMQYTGANISELEMITEEEKNRLLYEFNDTKAGFPKDKTIHQLFEEQVERTPDNIAVVAPSIGVNHESPLQITYKELNEKSNLVAHGLQKKGVGSDANPIVGIMMERSVEMVIGILAILKAGRAYLPIDPGYPAERIKYMLADSGTKVLLTTGTLAKEVKKIRRWEGKKNLEIIFLNTLSSPSFLTSYLHNFITSHPINVAYVIYTSGSTGKPKGVLVEHLSVVNYIWWAIKKYIMNNYNVPFPLFTSFSFDLTVTSIFTPLLSGNSIVVYGGKGKELLIQKVIEDNLVEVVKLTPSHLKLILDLVDDSFRSNIKRFIVGGEVLETQLAQKIHDNFKGDIEIYNEYGPTEATVGCMIYPFCHETDTKQSVPIGIPADNVRIFILDKNEKPVPMGVVGEFYIAGDGVTRGYLNQPELTAERFVHLVLTTNTIYKTGDLTRWLPDGNVEFLGRIDQQVKIRGFRIELGEIESQLFKCHDICEAIVIDRENSEGKKYLCAYLVSEKKIDISELRSILSKTLPDYMIPSYFIQVERIPLTANGKIDRKTLLSNGIELNSGVEFAAPRNDIEEKIANTWVEVLGLDKVGINENFFDLGGTSMDIIKLNIKFKEIFDEDQSVVQMFRYPTISSFARYLIEKREGVKTFGQIVEKTVQIDKVKKSRANQKSKRRGNINVRSNST